LRSSKDPKSRRLRKRSAFFFVPVLMFFLNGGLFQAVFGAVSTQSATVHEALMGHSVRLKGGKTLRYIGIQSPPLQSKIPLIRQYGQAAFDFNQKLTQGKKINIEWDFQIRDERGDLLGYAFLEDGTFVNLEILKAGHAKWVRTPPNHKYSAELRLAELQARRVRLGLWKEEPENPYIKDEYLGEKNTKIYYFPTSPELERIPQANLVNFRSRMDAKAAGYRPCSTCKEDAKLLE